MALECLAVGLAFTGIMFGLAFLVSRNDEPQRAEPRDLKQRPHIQYGA